MSDKRTKSEPRQNRPGWRKVRDWRRTAKRNNKGKPVRDARGRIKFDAVRVKTGAWERV